jgi:hypothetical protein
MLATDANLACQIGNAQGAVGGVIGTTAQREPRNATR